jgi:uncharacterized protein YgiM (DUF1202 family)
MQSPLNGTLADALLNINGILILVGLLILVINLIVGIFSIRSDEPRANWFNLLLVIAACVLLAAGIVRFSFGSVNFAGISLTEISTVLNKNLIPLFAAAIGAIVVIIAAMLLLRTERDQDTFDPSASNGLLNLGAGIFVLVAAIAIPLIPYQLTNIRASQAASVTTSPTVGSKTQVAAVQATQPINSPTPSLTPTLANTTTPMPSLTPTSSETPIMLYTQVVYVSTYAQTTPTKCTLTAKALTYLRGDPSEKQSAIGNVSAGSLMYVNGRTANHKWWYVSAPTVVDVSTMIDGWVRADYVTPDAACTDQEVRPLDATETPTRVPTQVGAPTVASPCSLITTTATALRPDPSRKQASLAQIAARTALTPISRLSDGSWWQVTYGTQTGWIGGASVMASSSCTEIPTQTP